jgi:hypothetical protein
LGFGGGSKQIPGQVGFREFANHEFGFVRLGQILLVFFVLCFGQSRYFVFIFEAITHAFRIRRGAELGFEFVFSQAFGSINQIGVGLNRRRGSLRKLRRRERRNRRSRRKGRVDAPRMFVKTMVLAHIIL